MRIVRLLAAVVMVLSCVGLASEPAGASQAVAFNIQKGPQANPNAWHGAASGNVTFFGTGRKVRVQGTLTFHQSPTAHGGGYVEARQNLTNTTSDPAWQAVTPGTCTSVPGPPDANHSCPVNRLFNPANIPGRRLAGVWLRICTSVKGPDPDTCGAARYRDNPLQG